MSVQPAIKRKTAPDIRARKNGEPIVMLTSYHAHTAALVDRYCDVILVGDSLGNVMHGFETTVPVTLDMMILQGRAVMRGSQHALVSLLGFVLIVWGFAHYRAAGMWEIWTPPTALKHLAVALMLPAVILVVAS